MEKLFEDLTTKELAALTDEECEKHVSSEWTLDKIKAEREECKKILKRMGY